MKMTTAFWTPQRYCALRIQLKSAMSMGCGACYLVPPASKSAIANHCMIIDILQQSMLRAGGLVIPSSTLRFCAVYSTPAPSATQDCDQGASDVSETSKVALTILSRGTTGNPNDHGTDSDKRELAGCG